MLEQKITPNKSLYPERDKASKLSHFLQASPFLELSDSSMEQIAKRFDITINKLKERISEYKAREGYKNEQPES